MTSSETTSRRGRRDDRERRNGDAYSSGNQDPGSDEERLSNGDDDPNPDHTWLPAVGDTRRNSGAEYDSPSILRYDDIPGELADALRGIINRYELRTGEKLPKSIAVTSALPGEGVTTVSQALATMIAQEMGSFVCWVDCAWLTVERAGERANGRPNLLEILADQSKIMSAFQASPDLPQLMSLSPGPVPESKRNMIVRTPEFDRLLAVLAEEFDHVVFDIPPVLTSVNGLALLRRSDASLLVVRHRSTTLTQVTRAIEATQPTPNLGAVLNRYRTNIPIRLRRLLGG